MPNLHKLQRFAILGLLLLVPVVTAGAQQDDPERRRAFQLYKDGKFVEALPVFEKLAAANPQDRTVQEYLGLIVYTQSAHLTDAGERKKARKRAREILLHAKELGSNSPTVIAFIESIPPDGGTDTSFSPQRKWMRQ
jgi:hypothetical protein